MENANISSDKPVVKKATLYSGAEHFVVQVAPNGWVESTESGALLFDRGEVEITKYFAKEFPDVEIIMSIGPHRFYNIAATFVEGFTRMLIDVYSPGVPSIKSQYVTDMITNAHRMLSEHKKDLEEVRKRA